MIQLGMYFYFFHSGAKDKKGTPLSEVEKKKHETLPQLFRSLFFS